jgi:hypothetical protein
MADPFRRPLVRKRRYQFGISAMLLATTLVAVLAAALAGLLRGEASDGLPSGFYYIMAAAAPVAAVICLSVYRAIVAWRTKRMQRPPP